MTDALEPGRGRAFGTSLCLGALATCVYVLLRQDALHGFDVWHLLRRLPDHGWTNERHPGYLPLLRGLAALTRPLGLDAFAVLCLGSALGTGVAVAALHRAALALGAGGRQAVWLALAVAVTPGVVHFATVAEYHAVHFGGAGLAFWATAAAVRYGGWRRAALAGAVSGVAATVHSSGQVLPALLVGLLVYERRGRPPGAPLRQAAALLAGHALAFGVAFAALLATCATDGEDPASFLLRYAGQGPVLAALPATLLHEALLPFLPASLLLLFALASAGERLLATLLLAATAGYTVLAALLLHGVTVEHGAYALPLAFPLWWCTSRLCTGRHPALPALLLLLAAVDAGVDLAHPERGAAERAFGRDAAAFAATTPVRLLLGRLTENDGLLLADGRREAVVVDLELAAMPDPAALPAAAITAWLQQQLANARRDRQALLVSDGAVARLQQAMPSFPAAWAAFVAAGGPQRLEQGALRGYLFAAS